MKIGVIIVCYDENVDSRILINSLNDQLTSEDKLVVVDNNPNHKNADNLKHFNRINYVIRNKNVGFGSACNQASALLDNQVDAYLFLNPDTHLAKDTIGQLKKANRNHSAYMANLMLDESRINNSGTIVHISGLSWSGGFNTKLEKPKTIYTKENYLSGACLLIWCEEFNNVGKFYEDYFLYYEDTDLCSRLISSGRKLALINDAYVYHDYTKSISNVKYLNIQKNRYRYMLINWPLIIIIYLLPAIILVDLLMIVESIINRRFILKMKSYYELVLDLNKIFKHRNQTMKLFKISNKEYFATLEPNFNSELIPNFLGKNILNAFFIKYYNLVARILN
jgi:GT2 family glycosyltransferase